MHIAIINRSPNISQTDARLMTEACARQLERDVRPAWWGPACSVRLYRKKAELPKNALAIVLMPDYTNAEDREAGFLGYHSEDAHGVRWGRVFTQPILDDGGSVLGRNNSISVALSHEVIEAYVDPDMNLWAEGARGTFWSYEACDPVEESSYAVRVKGVTIGVSNFVYPAWFDLEHRPRQQYDHLSELRGPFQVLGDGYAIFKQGSRVLTHWGKSYGPAQKLEKLRAKSSPLARSARRRR